MKENEMFGIRFTPENTRMTRKTLLSKVILLEQSLFGLWNCCRAHGLLPDTGVMDNAYNALTAFREKSDGTWFVKVKTPEKTPRKKSKIPR